MYPGAGEQQLGQLPPQAKGSITVPYLYHEDDLDVLNETVAGCYKHSIQNGRSRLDTNGRHLSDRSRELVCQSDLNIAGFK